MLGKLIAQCDVQNGMKLIGLVAGARGLIFPCTIGTTPVHLVAFMDGVPNGLHTVQILGRDWTESGRYWDVSECQIEPDFTSFRVERLDSLEATDNYTIHHTNEGWLIRGREPPPRSAISFWINITTAQDFRPNFEYGVSFDRWRLVKPQSNDQPHVLFEFTS